MLRYHREITDFSEHTITTSPFSRILGRSDKLVKGLKKGITN